MARLTIEQWMAAKADYEIAAMGINEIADKYGVNKAAVSRRAQKEDWQRGKSQQLSTRKAKAIIELADVEEQSQRAKLNSVERAVFDNVVLDEVSFRLQNDNDMEAVRRHVMALLAGVDRASDAKAIMDTLRIQREARLGKAPDTAIQINNNAAEQVSEDEAVARIAGIAKAAGARIAGNG